MEPPYKGFSLSKSSSLSPLSFLVFTSLRVFWTFGDESNIGYPVSSAVTARNENFCQLCQDFTTQTINFLKENETQTKIISTLHQVCSLLHSSKQCISLVDYYSSILSAEIAKAEPKQLCDNVKFCEKADVVHPIKNDDPCTICHNVVIEILTKLDDPDAQNDPTQRSLFLFALADSRIPRLPHSFSSAPPARHLPLTVASDEAPQRPANNWSDLPLRAALSASRLPPIGCDSVRLHGPSSSFVGRITPSLFP
ncbi:hypothetical protein KSP40_PGU002659 [Platanthera guangdongensis]|uniref:Saposin B-type domain-containing protein n=1 Tax=Platanthera guangdongensis TaxID=2320717 RepID=A0ABR2M8A9_9ASPA